MKCHYEILEITKDADDSQIKTAYRKLALKWHPDKNLDSPDHAKEQFQLLQQAYEVLSDRQERAWYDNHREQILRGSNSEFEDDSLDVFQYFTTTCFKGYSDEENGFYTVYRKIFEEIAREDIEYMDDKEEFCEIPSFGTSSSDYDDIVGPFYTYWMSYSTKKSYVWLDPYNIKETRDRKIYKLMEKENKKIRQKAKKDRNDEIRALVAFVRKRDKRVQENSKKLEAKILENRQKQEELSKQKRIERKKQLIESHSQAEWTKFDNVKTELEQIEKSLAQEFGEQITDDDNEESNSEAELDNLYCVACNKIFKTEKAFQNHELSKKHKENVETLKELMVEEDKNLNESPNSHQVEDSINNEDSIEELSCTELTDDEIQVKQKKKQKKSKNVIKVHVSDHEELSTLDSQTANVTNPSAANSDDDFNFNASKKLKRKNKKNGVKSDNGIDKSSVNTQTQNVDNNLHDTLDEESIEKQESVKKRSNKKCRDKRGKKEMETQQIDIDTGHCCVTCKADFSSKNKLFDHLKKTGHSVYLPQNDKNLKSKKKSVKEK